VIEFDFEMAKGAAVVVDGEHTLSKEGIALSTCQLSITVRLI